ncbi:hypothetical protein [Streptomyces sp. NPDC096132]|uniref:hypothetical protein n=1 Tax=Streptomyces sp. NPDC096132 TaxID=3366075 RepID=UPI0037F7C8DB
MTGRHNRGAGFAGLWFGLWGLGRALALGAHPWKGTQGNPRESTYLHVCGFIGCTARLQWLSSGTSKQCANAHRTAVVHWGGRGPKVLRSTLYIYACMPCMTPLVRSATPPDPQSLVCPVHGTPLTLLVEPR